MAVDDRVTPTGPSGLLRWADLTIGAAAGATEVTTAGLVGVRNRLDSSGRRIAEHAVGLRRRLARPAGQDAAQGLAGLATRGADRRRQGQERIEQVARRLADTFVATATSPLVNRVVDAQLARVMHSVVDDVLALLEREPERIQALARGQRDTMVGEAVGRLRTGAAAGDAAVDRLTLRMTRRGPTDPP